MPRQWLPLIVMMLTVEAFAQSRPTTLPSLDDALQSNRDVWGELAIKQPDGPSYAFFENLLPPLRYDDASGRDYAITLAAPRQAHKARLRSSGGGINLLASKANPNWHGDPIAVTFSIDGCNPEPIGKDPSRREGQTYADGYLPIVQTRYHIGEATITEECFVSTDQPFAAHGVAFVRFSVDRGSTALAAALDTKLKLALDNSAIKDEQGNTAVYFGNGWAYDPAAKHLSATLSHDRPLLLAIITDPFPAQNLTALDEPTFTKLRTNCAKEWNRQLQQCANLQTPEDVVNRAWKSIVISDLMIATADQMNYSAGNAYERLYEAESGDALRSLLLYGLADETRDMIDPLLRYHQAHLEEHDAGFKLQLLSHFYSLTHDAQFIRDHTPLWRAAVDFIIKSREPRSGLLPKERYCGDIGTMVYSLNSNANSWRGLRDIAAVLKDIGDAQQSAEIAKVAEEFHGKILAAIDASERRDVSPPFIPVALFGAEKPYDPLTATKLGSYWDLMIPYVLGSGILDARRTDAVIDYLQTRGGVCMGMIRFHQHSGLFANEDGVDDLYGLRYTQTLLRRDYPGDADRALVSFYGKLAQGLTRDTFIGGEGSSLRPLDAHGRGFYLPPNTSSNALFLTTLRELLIQDVDADEDGTPDTLRLLYATPRAWLRDGATLKFAHAPTAFGPLSIVVHANLTAGEVAINVTPPPRAPKATKLRLRLPDGWSADAASIGAAQLPLVDNTIDLTAERKPVQCRVHVSHH